MKYYFRGIFVEQLEIVYFALSEPLRPQTASKIFNSQDAFWSFWQTSEFDHQLAELNINTIYLVKVKIQETFHNFPINLYTLSRINMK